MQPTTRVPAASSVLIADEQPIYRLGLRTLLNSTDDLVPAGEASDGEEAIRLCAELQPDVIVMGVSMPKLIGIEAAEAILNTRNAPRVVIHSYHVDVGLARAALALGADAYISKSKDPTVLLEALREAIRRKRAGVLAARHGLRASHLGLSKSALTQREQEVLCLVSAGISNAEIAEHLGISSRTVDAHRARIMQKLNLHNVAQLVRRAYHLGVADLAIASATEKPNPAEPQAAAPKAS